MFSQWQRVQEYFFEIDVFHLTQFRYLAFYYSPAASLIASKQPFAYGLCYRFSSSQLLFKQDRDHANAYSAPDR
ncbi:predicted protein [Plenodomus lingam JN3]|uniref:Predicted protein n=1 Tax=Leptosphaeria maculans (strain JN3 / isolate v23.1.3 / race Av1-4-5-6-7-8) TaxID=985895 RepID=E5A9F1_LEPMJ|nr:predicted protein [Plenodomus lingam JN3]CBY00292.1 predicted protein [Plenodomus lingam JN3]